MPEKKLKRASSNSPSFNKCCIHIHRQLTLFLSHTSILNYVRKLANATREIGLFYCCCCCCCLSITHFLLIFVLFVCLFVCFLQALTIYPSNRAVQDQLRILKEKERKHDEHFSRALGAMFGRKV